MRLITIDNGNTNSTIGIFKDHKLIKVCDLKDYQKEENDFILASSVGKKLDLKPSYDLKKHRTTTHFFDMPIEYAMSLGDDRMISAYGVFKNIKNEDRHLIIDAGTFITCDLVSKDGFLGGFIFPGIDRFLATYPVSENLPKLTLPDLRQHKITSVLPQTTEAAILEATVIYLREIILKVIETTSPDKVTLTGGSAIDIKDLINLKVPFELSHHLVHLGLGLIHQRHLHQA